MKMVLSTATKDSGARQTSTKVSSRSFNSSKTQNGSHAVGKERRNTGVTSAGSNPPQHPAPSQTGDMDGDADKGRKKPSAPHEQQSLCTEVGVVSVEDIQKLSIRDEDLQMVRKSMETLSDDSKTIHISRYVVKKQKPAVEQVKQPKKLIVARTAPQDAELKPIDYSGPSGPRYKHDTGEIIPHTLLGSVEDFVAEAIKQNYIESESRSAVISPVSRELPIKPSKPGMPLREPPIRMALNQENALLNWQHKMVERKRQQEYISELLQKPVDRLVMHKDDEFRQIQEKRNLVDRAIPSLDYGKGYRVGSEFWRQHENFGDDIRGIKMTLTKTERGAPIEFEHVAKPSALRHETGLLNPDSEETSQDPSRSWKESEYLKQRCRQLEPVMLQLDPLRPKMKHLQVIGQGYDKENVDDVKDGEPYGRIQMQSPEKYDSREVECTDPLEKYPDVFPQQLQGPSIVFGETLASWNGSSTDNVGKTGYIARVFFETLAKEKTTSHLKIQNNGTTAIYYHWRKLPTPPAFEAIKRDSKQRFYFNNGEGAILPDETKKFPFIFKSPNPGIFTETWQFLTEPVVLGGASLQVSLKGVAVQDDTSCEAKHEILKEISMKEAEVAAKSIIDEIISSIRGSDRPPSPVGAYITEQELFKRCNPSCQYDYETILELKNFYLQLFPEETRAEHEWSLSLPELKDCITAIPDESAKEELLAGLSTVIGRLGSKNFFPTENAMYGTCYGILQEALDGFCSCSMRIRSIMELPEIVMEPISDVDITAAAATQPTAAETKVYSAKSAASSEPPAGHTKRVKTPAEDKKAKGAKKPVKEDPKAKAKGKKDTKEKERPKSNAKGGKGRGASAATTPSKEAPLSDRDLAVKTPSSVKPPAVDALDQVTRKKYTEKMYSQVYNMLCEAFENMSEIFLDIKEAEMRTEV